MILLAKQFNLNQPQCKKETDFYQQNSFHFRDFTLTKFSVAGNNCTNQALTCTKLV